MTRERPNEGPWLPNPVKPSAFYFVVLIVILNITCSYSAPVTTEVALQEPEKGCFYMMQHYDEGERIITNEPCLNCTCHDSMLMCFLKVCPFAKPIGQDCIVEKRPDQCCPVITCPEVPVPLMIGVVSTTTRPVTPSLTGLATLSDEEGCLIEGKYYPDGAQVPSDPNKPCDLCYCIRNHTACVMQECILYVDGCSPVFEVGVCCPVRYECDRDKRPLIIGTTAPPAIANSDMCVRNGEVYVDGSLVQTEDPCEHCYCMHGDIVCAVQECGRPMQPLGNNCVAVAPPEGQCCPEAYECTPTNDETTTALGLVTSAPTDEADEKNEIPDVSEGTLSSAKPSLGQESLVSGAPEVQETTFSPVDSSQSPEHGTAENGVTGGGDGTSNVVPDATAENNESDKEGEEGDKLDGSVETSSPSVSVPAEENEVFESTDFPITDTTEEVNALNSGLVAPDSAENSESSAPAVSPESVAPATDSPVLEPEGGKPQSGLDGAGTDADRTDAPMTADELTTSEKPTEGEQKPEAPTSSTEQSIPEAVEPESTDSPVPAEPGAVQPISPESTVDSESTDRPESEIPESGDLVLGTQTTDLPVSEVGENSVDKDDANSAVSTAPVGESDKADVETGAENSGNVQVAPENPTNEGGIESGNESGSHAASQEVGSPSTEQTSPQASAAGAESSSGNQTSELSGSEGAGDESSSTDNPQFPPIDETESKPADLSESPVASTDMPADSQETVDQESPNSGVQETTDSVPEQSEKETEVVGSNEESDNKESGAEGTDLPETQSENLGQTPEEKPEAAKEPELVDNLLGVLAPATDSPSAIPLDTNTDSDQVAQLVPQVDSADPSSAEQSTDTPIEEGSGFPVFELNETNPAAPDENSEAELLPVDVVAPPTDAPDHEGEVDLDNNLMSQLQTGTGSQVEQDNEDEGLSTDNPVDADKQEDAEASTDFPVDSHPGGAGSNSGPDSSTGDLVTSAKPEVVQIGEEVDAAPSTDFPATDLPLLELGEHSDADNSVTSAKPEMAQMTIHEPGTHTETEEVIQSQPGGGNTDLAEGSGSSDNDSGVAEAGEQSETTDLPLPDLSNEDGVSNTDSAVEGSATGAGATVSQSGSPVDENLLEINPIPVQPEVDAESSTDRIDEAENELIPTDTPVKEVEIVNPEVQVPSGESEDLETGDMKVDTLSEVSTDVPVGVAEAAGQDLGEASEEAAGQGGSSNESTDSPAVEVEDQTNTDQLVISPVDENANLPETHPDNHVPDTDLPTQSEISTDLPLPTGEQLSLENSSNAGASPLDLTPESTDLPPLTEETDEKEGLSEGTDKPVETAAVPVQGGEPSNTAAISESGLKPSEGSLGEQSTKPDETEESGESTDASPLPESSSPSEGSEGGSNLEGAEHIGESTDVPAIPESGVNEGDSKPSTDGEEEQGGKPSGNEENGESTDTPTNIGGGSALFGTEGEQSSKPDEEDKEEVSTDVPTILGSAPSGSSQEEQSSKPEQTGLDGGSTDTPTLPEAGENEAELISSVGGEESSKPDEVGESTDIPTVVGGESAPSGSSEEEQNGESTNAPSLPGGGENEVDLGLAVGGEGEQSNKPDEAGQSGESTDTPTVVGAGSAPAAGSEGGDGSKTNEGEQGGESTDIPTVIEAGSAPAAGSEGEDGSKPNEAEQGGESTDIPTVGAGSAPAAGSEGEDGSKPNEAEQGGESTDIPTVAEAGSAPAAGSEGEDGSKPNGTGQGGESTGATPEDGKDKVELTPSIGSEGEQSNKPDEADQGEDSTDIPTVIVDGSVPSGNSEGEQGSKPNENEESGESTDTPALPDGGENEVDHGQSVAGESEQSSDPEVAQSGESTDIPLVAGGDSAPSGSTEGEQSNKLDVPVEATTAETLAEAPGEKPVEIPAGSLTLDKEDEQTVDQQVGPVLSPFPENTNRPDNSDLAESTEPEEIPQPVEEKPVVTTKQPELEDVTAATIEPEEIDVAAPGTEQPDSVAAVTKEPETEKEDAAPGTDKPETAEEVPVDSTQQSVEPEGESSEATQKPAAGPTDEHDDKTDSTIEATQKPQPMEEVPVESTDVPAPVEEKPASGDQTEGDSVMPPQENSTQPEGGDDSNKQSELVDGVSGAATNEPGSEDAVNFTEQSAPLEENQSVALAEETTDDSTKLPSPGEGNYASGTEQQKPADETSATPSEQPKPVEEISATASEQPKPAEETSATASEQPAEEISETASEQPKPAEEVPAETTKRPEVEATVVDEQDLPSTDAPEVEPLPVAVPGSCLVDGTTYADGARVPSNSPCMVDCVCQASVVTCAVADCPPPPAGLNCSPVLRAGDCCPQYVCPGSCFIDGEIYQNLSPVPTNNSCQSCYCLNSVLQCATPVCSRPTDLGCRLVKVRVEGECCPSWRCASDGEDGLESVFPVSQSQTIDQSGSEPESQDKNEVISVPAEPELVPDDAVIFPGPPSFPHEIPEEIAPVQQVKPDVVESPTAGAAPEQKPDGGFVDEKPIDAMEGLEEGTEHGGSPGNATEVETEEQIQVEEVKPESVPAEKPEESSFEGAAQPGPGENLTAAEGESESSSEAAGSLKPDDSEEGSGVAGNETEQPSAVVDSNSEAGPSAEEPSPADNQQVGETAVDSQGVDANGQSSGSAAPEQEAEKEVSVAEQSADKETSDLESQKPEEGTDGSSSVAPEQAGGVEVGTPEAENGTQGAVGVGSQGTEEGSRPELESGSQVLPDDNNSASEKPAEVENPANVDEVPSGEFEQPAITVPASVSSEAPSSAPEVSSETPSDVDSIAPVPDSPSEQAGSQATKPAENEVGPEPQNPAEVSLSGEAMPAEQGGTNAGSVETSEGTLPLDTQPEEPQEQPEEQPSQPAEPNREDSISEQPGAVDLSSSSEPDEGQAPNPAENTAGQELEKPAEVSPSEELEKPAEQENTNAGTAETSEVSLPVDIQPEEPQVQPAEQPSKPDSEDSVSQPPVAVEPSSESTLPQVESVGPPGVDQSESTDGFEEEEESPDIVIGPGACLFDGKVFVSAQQIPRDDPCDFCFCFRGDIICLQQSCPPPIPGCFEEAIGGFCCPRYECPVRQAFQNITLQPTLPPLALLLANRAPVPLQPTQVQVQGCEILGDFFRQGEVIPRASGPCLECKCGTNGMMECDPRACQPEPMLRKMMAAAVKRRRRSLGRRLGKVHHFHLSGDRLVLE